MGGEGEKNLGKASLADFSLIQLCYGPWASWPSSWPSQGPLILSNVLTSSNLSRMPAHAGAA